MVLKKLNKFTLAILIMGFSGIVAQILLLRELLISFLGNELSIGIILANWLILEAAGAFFIGKKVAAAKNPVRGFVVLSVLFSLFLPLTIYLARIVRVIIGVTYGEGLGLVDIFYSSFIVILGVSVFHGALFTLSCKIYSLLDNTDTAATSIGRVYVIETLGTMAGGVAITFLLIQYFLSFEIAIGIALLNLTLCVFLVGPFWQKKSGLSERLLSAAACGLAIIFAYIIISPTSHQIHKLSIDRQFKGQEVVHYQNSIYGNVTLTKREDQYTLFSDGVPIITTPTPDIVFVEELVHFAALFHPKPENVLVLSGGAGGVINEILKYPSIVRIDYAELDPLILEIIKKSEYITPLIEKELNNPKVSVSHIDGRLFVKRTHTKYDIIIVGFSNPQDLQINRLFTKEFFLLAKEKLKEDGILVTSLPGSLTYISDELKNLNSCIIRTLESVFEHIRIIPGDGTNLFLTSKSLNFADIDYTTLGRRLDERKPDVNLITEQYIEYKLHARWLEWFLNSIEDGTKKINYDLKPVGVFYSLTYWNALFSPYISGLFKWFENVRLFSIFILIFAVTTIFLIIRFKVRSLFKVSIPLSITTTGFAGMIFDLALIFTFQVIYGYVFHWLGLLVGSFMVGVAAGGITATSILRGRDTIKNLFIKTELAIILFSLILPAVFLLVQPYLVYPIIFSGMRIIFLILSAFSGFLIGIQFPLASHIHLGKSSTLGQTAGLIYASDLFGGFIGGIIGGVVLLPLLGLWGSCLVVAMIKLSTLIILKTGKTRLLN